MRGTHPVRPRIRGAQSRHASWSPTARRSCSPTAPRDRSPPRTYDLFVRDFATNTLTRRSTTSRRRPQLRPPRVVARRHEDRLRAPAGEPGEHRARHQGQDGRHGFARGEPDDRPAPRRSSSSRPGARTPQTIYFAQSPTPSNVAGENFDIVSKPSERRRGRCGDQRPDDTAVERVPAVDLARRHQDLLHAQQTPAQFCARRTIFIPNLPAGGGKSNISDNAGQGDINCTCSPDGTKVAYSKGTFGSGRAEDGVRQRRRRHPDSSARSATTPGATTSTATPTGRLDGAPALPGQHGHHQPEHADHVHADLHRHRAGVRADRPERSSRTTRPDERRALDQRPAPAIRLPSYTPNPGFAGTDTFEFGSFDDFGFGADRGNDHDQRAGAPAARRAGGGGGGGGAKPRCGGRPPRSSAPPARNTLVGTNGRDVIAALGGNDTIRGGRGNDIICGGSGQRPHRRRQRQRPRRRRQRQRPRLRRLRQRQPQGRRRQRPPERRLRPGPLNGGSGRDRLNGGRGATAARAGAGATAAGCERSSSIP